MKTPLVMLVDDEVSFVETLEERLNMREMQILTAFSGSEALNKLESHINTDVIILDVKMPGMDGTEVLKEIKKIYPLIEVIMLTGHATVKSAIEGMKLGAFDYLMKPCDIDELVNKVNEAFKKKQDHEDKIKDAQVKDAMSKHGIE